MEKDEDVNWVRTNLRTGKNHSAERGDTLRRSCTVIPQLAAQKLYGICTEALRIPHGICADFPRNLSDFVKFLVTCTVYEYAMILIFLQIFFTKL